MTDTVAWDWETREKRIPVGDWNSRFEWVEEPYASPDGERIAAIVNSDEGEFNVCVNGQSWETPFEKIWHLRFTADGRLTALVSDMGEWTVAVDGTLWENRFGYVWNPLFSRDGRSIAVSYQSDRQYGMALNDVPWEKTYANLTDPVLSPDGNHTAGSVQVISAGEAEIHKFQQGTISAAMDGVLWDRIFVNVWNNAISLKGDLAAEVRLTLYDYTIAVNGVPWEKTFGGVWEPVFHPVNGKVLAPVRVKGKWHLAQDGELIWKSPYVQLWHLLFSPDGKSLAAIVATGFGKWTVAVDDRAWNCLFSDFVTDLTFSPDSRKIAAVVKDNERWGLAVQGSAWKNTFDMVWKPVFSPDGAHVAAKVERVGKFTIALNDRLWPHDCEAAWDPWFSPDGTRLLFRTIENGVYFRRVIPVSEFGG
ncbi:MAG: WD40 repeat domain-containing protein [Deltaproteobacteria bacterium]|nr:WD40 repeat domain-containing protein [Deltaproteobacteria bacterium]